MTKKILIVLTLLASLTFFTSIVLANTDMNNMANDATNVMSDSWNKMSTTMENLGNNTKGAINSAGNAIQGAMNNIENTLDMNTDDNSTDSNYNSNANDDNFNDSTDYTATRTAATTNNNMFGLNSNTWTWVVLAVLGIAIIGLVWYYGMQTQNTSKHMD